MKIKLNPVFAAMLIALLALLLIDGSLVYAEEEADHFPDGPVHRSFPPLPAISPRIGPNLVIGSHHRDDAPTTEKWIDVDLSDQRVVAYEGVNPRRSFAVSTGLPNTPTRVGEFRIWIKTRIQDMDGGSKENGDYYYLPDVEWVQYFDGEIGFHGTYWHDNFGQPMSRGCVNMTNEDAKWLFEWAGPDYDFEGPAWQAPGEDKPGTLVVVHE